MNRRASVVSAMLASAGSESGCGGSGCGGGHDDTDPRKETFWKTGTGPNKVLCLHGWFGCAKAWGPFVDCLDTRNFTYAFMDYRGYGRRRGSGGDYTIAEIAGDALAVVDYLGWKRFSVLGHSMGGLAAQQVLADAPDRVQALVGVSPVPAGSVPFDDAGWALFSSAVGDADARRSIMDSSTGFRLTGTWLDAMVRGSLEHSDAEAFAAYLHVWSDTSGTSNTPNTSLSLIDRIQGKTLPVLIVAGEYDAGISGQFCRDTWLRYYPNAVLEVMANAGHYAMNETPVRLAKLIEDFLRDKL